MIWKRTCELGHVILVWVRFLIHNLMMIFCGLSDSPLVQSVLPSFRLPFVVHTTIRPSVRFRTQYGTWGGAPAKSTADNHYPGDFSALLLDSSPPFSSHFLNPPKTVVQSTTHHHHRCAAMKPIEERCCSAFEMEIGTLFIRCGRTRVAGWVNSLPRSSQQLTACFSCAAAVSLASPVFNNFWRSILCYSGTKWIELN